MSALIIKGLLALGAAIAVGGYLMTAHYPLGDRSQLPPLLIAFILAIGFLGLVA